MSDLSRRKLIATGLGITAGATGLAVAAKIGQRAGLIPPDCGGVYGLGETLTYGAQRLLTSHSMAREFRRDQMSKVPFANGEPAKEIKALPAAVLADWKLAIDGMVAHPGSFSMADLKSYPQRSHITHLACEEGWSYIAEWIGVPLSHVLRVAGILPQAKFVVYYSLEKGWWDSLDMADALHPQTFLAYGINGGDLPLNLGGPLRMRVPRQLGYKNVKYITRLVVTDDIKKFGKGLGSASPEGGYAWYAGI